MDFVDLDILIDRPPLLSVARLVMEDGSEQYEVVTADDAPDEVFRGALDEIPGSFTLTQVDYDVEESSLGVPASVRRYRSKASAK